MKELIDLNVKGKGTDRCWSRLVYSRSRGCKIAPFLETWHAYWIKIGIQKWKLHSIHCNTIKMKRVTQDDQEKPANFLLKNRGNGETEERKQIKTGEETVENRSCTHNLSVNSDGVFTEKINNQAAITVSSRWFLEVSLSVRWIKAFNPSSNKITSVRIWITKVENSRKFEFNRISNRQQQGDQGEDLQNANLGSHWRTRGLVAFACSLLVTIYK